MAATLADTADLDAQIAKLEALRAAKLARAAAEQRRREGEEAKVLVGDTPTKKREAARAVALPAPPKQPVFARPAAASSSTTPTQPQPSSLSSALAKRRERQPLPSLPVARTTSFADRPEPRDDDELEVVRTGGERDADGLTVLEDLKMGPGDFGKDPEGEEMWEHLEPNSGIRLSKRLLPHAELQDHLYGRFFLKPSQLYSAVRLSRDGATYDVPVAGDWLTIAVVAERSDVRVSGTRDTGYGSDDEAPDKGAARPPTRPLTAAEKDKRERLKDKGNKRGPRKYVNLKLCALGPRTKGSSGGDALLQLLLFEADAVGEKDGGGKLYKGGSGGAYETWCNIAVGSVVAVLNPRVLRPLSGGGAAPHPLTLPLALNPTSAQSVTLIGHAMDIGRCTATQRDGKRCRTWVDTRVANVCEYHIHAAVQRGRSSRAEFASATTSFALTASSAGSAGVRGRGGGQADVRRRNGLLVAKAGAQPAPRGTDNGGGGTTYVVGAGVVRTGARFGDEHVGEKMGRARAEKRKRQAEEKEAEESLRRLLQNGHGTTGAKYLAKLGQQVEAAREGTDGDADGKRAFSATAIKRIGYDPSSRGRTDMAKSESLIDLRNESARPLKLGRIGPRVLSHVVVPKSAEAPSMAARTAAAVEDEDDEMVDLD
ncbi:hypothetical protein Q5752_003897 [Cryptotrichosporon argae]